MANKEISTYNKQIKIHKINNHHLEKNEAHLNYLEILEAAKIGDIGWFDKLTKKDNLNLNFTITLKTGETTSIIKMACLHQNYHIIHHLINNTNIDVHILDDYLIKHACANGLYMIVQKLIYKGEFSKETLSESLLLACFHDHVSIVHFLHTISVGLGKAIGSSMDMYELAKKPLHEAIRGEAINVFTYFVIDQRAYAIGQNGNIDIIVGIIVEKLYQYRQRDINQFKKINIIIRTLMDKWALVSETILQYPTLHQYISDELHLK